MFDIFYVDFSEEPTSFVSYVVFFLISQFSKNRENWDIKPPLFSLRFVTRDCISSCLRSLTFLFFCYGVHTKFWFPI